jgi:hypothetical protein
MEPHGVAVRANDHGVAFRVSVGAVLVHHQDAFCESDGVTTHGERVGISKRFGLGECIAGGNPNGVEDSVRVGGRDADGNGERIERGDADVDGQRDDFATADGDGVMDRDARADGHRDGHCFGREWVVHGDVALHDVATDNDR